MKEDLKEKRVYLAYKIRKVKDKIVNKGTSRKYQKLLNELREEARLFHVINGILSGKSYKQLEGNSKKPMDLADLYYSVARYIDLNRG